METLIPGEGGGVQVKKREETVSGVRLEPKEQTGGMVSIGPSSIKKESAVCRHFWGLACCGYWASILWKLYNILHQESLGERFCDSSCPVSTLYVNLSNYYMLIRNIVILTMYIGSC